MRMKDLGRYLAPSLVVEATVDPTVTARASDGADDPEAELGAIGGTDRGVLGQHPCAWISCSHLTASVSQPAVSA